MAGLGRLLELLGSRVATGAGLTAVGTGSYVIWADSTRYLKICEAFSTGSVLPPLSDTTYQTPYLSRPADENRLRTILQPRFTNEYYFLHGEVGTGKTRLVLEMVRHLMATSGKRKEGAPIYVLASQGKGFADTLAASVKFTFDEHISLRFFMNFLMGIQKMPSKNEAHKLQRVLDAIEEAAFEYTQKHGQPVVLVIDDTNYLAVHLPNSLERLQDKAKLWADTNIAKVVFISNDEESQALLSANQSSWSRADNPLYIGDLERDAAVEFLMKPCCCGPTKRITGISSEDTKDGTGISARQAKDRKGIDAETAQCIIDLVGGRLHHLLQFRHDMTVEGGQYEHTATRLKGKEREKLLTVQKSDSAMKAVARLMAEPSGRMRMDKFSQLLPEADFSCLLKQNILSIYREQACLVVKFDSKLMEYVTKEWLELKEGKVTAGPA